MSMGNSIAKVINKILQIYFLMATSISIFCYAQTKIVKYRWIN